MKGIAGSEPRVEPHVIEWHLGRRTSVLGLPKFAPCMLIDGFADEHVSLLDSDLLLQGTNEGNPRLDFDPGALGAHL